jgi:hypothetical protein
MNGAKLITGETLYIHGGYHIIEGTGWIRDYTANEILKDATPVTIRAIQRDDKSRLLEAFKSFDRSVYRRFSVPRKS